MKYLQQNKVFIILITTTCVLLFLFPYSFVYTPDNDAGTEGWKAAYILDDVILAVIYIPFPVTWALYLLIKKGLLKKIMQLILLIVSAIYFYLSLLNLLFAGPDVSPSTGAFIPLLLLPLLSVYFIMGARAKPNRLAATVQE